MRINIPSTVTSIGERVFEYWGNLELAVLPEGLQQLGWCAFCRCTSLKTINIPPNIESIKDSTFLNCGDLTDVTFSEGLREIGEDAFSRCKSLVSVTLPSSLKSIGVESFEGCKVLNKVHIPETIESIGARAFKDCNFTNFRIPPQVTEADISILKGNDSLVSLELPENTLEFTASSPLSTDLSVRNIALPSACRLKNANIYIEFPDENDTATLEALQHRFDELPIHKICYYQSYHDNETTMQNLKREINPWTTKPPGQLNTSGKEQDCLGMTPLHILACSIKQNVEMYQLLIDKYPETLVIKDKWGDIPLIYAIWCNASTEALDLLVENYKSLHPDYEFNWSGMLLTLAKRNVPLVNIEKLINTQQHSFPDQEYNVQVVVGELAKCYTRAAPRRSASTEVFRYLLRVSTTKRLDILGITKWRLDLENSIGAFRDETERERTTKALYDRLDMYELAKEATSILELATWKHKMDESTPSSNAKSTGQSNKRARVDTNISERQQYRVNCGANIVVRNVLPYLLPK